MRRKRPQTYGQSLNLSRILPMLMALGVLGILYERFRDPNTWSWMAHGTEARATEIGPNAIPKAEQIRETIVPGPNDLDDAQIIDFRAMCRVLEDKNPLKNFEMPAYWKLLSWSRTQPFSELERRARADVAFRQMWESPDVYRGKLMKLRIHVRMVLKQEELKNNLGIPVVYEIWGPTDESVSYPYCVVVPEVPEGLPIGARVDAEVEFVGYFFKVLRFETFDAKKASPMLIGKLRLVSAAKKIKVAKTGGWELWLLAVGGGVVVAGFVTGGVLTRSRRTKAGHVPTEVTPEALPSEFFASASVDGAMAHAGTSEAAPESSDAKPAVAANDAAT